MDVRNLIGWQFVFCPYLFLAYLHFGADMTHVRNSRGSVNKVWLKLVNRKEATDVQRTKGGDPYLTGNTVHPRQKGGMLCSKASRPSTLWFLDAPRVIKNIKTAGMWLLGIVFPITFPLLFLYYLALCLTN